MTMPQEEPQPQPEALASVADTLAALDEAGRLLRLLRGQLVRQLHQGGASLRSIADRAGVSFQRVQQWEKDRP